MRRVLRKPVRPVLLAAALLFFVFFIAASAPSPYPPARRDETPDDYHGVWVADPYRWLERSDSTETQAWLDAEKRLTARRLAGIRFRSAIRRRLAELWSFPRTEVPWREAGRIFYERNSGRDPQPSLYAQDAAESAPRLVLDPKTISSDGSVAVRDYAVSPDGRFLSYRASRGGEDLGVVRVRELATGRELPGAVDGVLNFGCWTHDGGGFFYVGRREGASREGSGPVVAKRLLYHALGRAQAEDRVVQEWGRAAVWAYAMASEDGRRVIVVAEEGTKTEVSAIDLGDPKRPDVAADPSRRHVATPLLAGRTGFHTPIDIVGSTLYLRTTLDAPHQRVAALDLDRGGAAELRDVIPEASDVILDAVIAGDRLVVHYLADAKSRVRLFSLDGRPAGELALPGIGAVGWPLGARVSSPELFYSYASYLFPASVYRVDVRTGASVPFRAPRVPFDAAAYETRQVFYTSKDGTRAPMFVTAAKGVALDGSHPALLTAYGGYGISTRPGYEPDVPLWLELGGVHAVAVIRGGGEYGEEWHRAGMLGRKQNGFDDFFAAAEHLIAERYTSRDRLAIYGHSNGGLLVGAAITQRPDLFAAAVANAGHYDMLRYQKFTAGSAWVSEFGSSEDPAAFPNLRAYSPLHNVQAGTCYPATLLLAADHDDRVVPLHSYKFAAALQAAQACDRPVLLRVAAGASHSYASRQVQIDERADMWAFLADRLGVAVPAARAAAR